MIYILFGFYPQSGLQQEKQLLCWIEVTGLTWSVKNMLAASAGCVRSLLPTLFTQYKCEQYH